MGLAQLAWLPALTAFEGSVIQRLVSFCSMENIESFIDGSAKLTHIFGYWPSFHDAEVIELGLWRGDVEPEAGRYVFPILKVQLHVWELTTDTNSKGFLVLRYHTLTT